MSHKLQKMKIQLEKEITKSRKSDKQVDMFRNWLGGLLGVRKVVDGCEQMMMSEISNRLANCPRH